jgi:hypothetical protein
MYGTRVGVKHPVMMVILLVVRRSGHRLCKCAVESGDRFSLQRDALVSNTHTNHATTWARSMCYKLSFAQPGCPMRPEKTVR